MPDPVCRLSFDEVIDRLLALKRPYHKNYLAMYSSWYGGIVTDPALMMIPVDDHLVHRGDGIFEACKCTGGKVYALDRHLDRMARSAETSVLNLPERSRLVEIVLDTIRAAGIPDCLLKILVSRGPGGFSANPYECPESQLYVVAAILSVPPPEKYEKGVRIISSRIPMKSDVFAIIKSCNYLPNVLMKMEAEDAGAEYAISIDDGGFLGEGPTENIGIVTRNKEFLVPKFGRVLRGITVTRVMELADSLIREGILVRVGEADITPRQAYDAVEVMMFGTSFDVLPVVDYDGREIGGGTPGPVFRRFLDLLRGDVRNCSEMTIPVEGEARGR